MAFFAAFTPNFTSSHLHIIRSS